MGDIQRKLRPFGTQQISASGTTIYVKRSSERGAYGQVRDAEIDIVLDGGETYACRPGDKIKTQGFSHFVIRERSEKTVDVTLVVTSGDFSQRVTAGAVKIDNSVAVTLSDTPTAAKAQAVLSKTFDVADEFGTALCNAVDNPIAINVLKIVVWSSVDGRLDIVNRINGSTFAQFTAETRFGFSHQPTVQNALKIAESGSLQFQPLSIITLSQNDAGAVGFNQQRGIVFYDVPLTANGRPVELFNRSDGLAVMPGSDLHFSLPGARVYVEWCEVELPDALQQPPAPPPPPPS